LGWNTIKGRQYYYHSVATPTGVKTTYYGNGKRAHEAAARHAAQRVANREQQEAQRRYIRDTGNALAPVKEAFIALEQMLCTRVHPAS
jgi:hypothetical protein